LSTSAYGSVLPYTILNVNAPIYGSNGANGFWINGGDYKSCKGIISIYEASGKNGNSAINFSGFSGKTVVINNNSIIKGGLGGNGTNRSLCTISYNSCSIDINYNWMFGYGANWKINESGVNIILNGNSPINGSNGNYGKDWYCEGSA
jgi:hypothetical protein